MLLAATYLQILLPLGHAKMEPWPGQKIKISNNCSNNSLKLSIHCEETLSVLCCSRVQNCVCTRFCPCYISSSHKHWQSQFIQKHAEEWCKNGSLPVRERAQAGYWPKSVEWGAQTGETAPTPPVGGCIREPHHLSLMSADKKKYCYSKSHS